VLAISLVALVGVQLFSACVRSCASTDSDNQSQAQQAARIISVASPLADIIGAAPYIGGKDDAWLLGQGIEACAELGVIAANANSGSAAERDCCVSDKPEQVAVFRTATHTTVIVQWVMRQYDVSQAILQWWPSDAKSGAAAARRVNASIRAPSKWYAADNWLLRSACGFGGGPGAYKGFIYRAVVTGLPTNTPLSYAVGAGDPQMAPLRLVIRDAAGANNDMTARTIVVADIGVRGGRHTWAAVSKILGLGVINQLLAVGDVSYHNGYARVYDELFRLADSLHVFSSVPLLTAPGNHENAYEFAAYLDRFPQPTPTIPAPNERPGQGFYDVIDGNVHWISLNFESKGAALSSHMIPIEDAMPLTNAEFDWLETTLRHIRRNSKAGEWIVVYSHRYEALPRVVPSVFFCAQFVATRMWATESTQTYIAGH
jgi:hypothetical protein